MKEVLSPFASCTVAGGGSFHDRGPNPIVNAVLEHSPHTQSARTMINEVVPSSRNNRSAAASQLTREMQQLTVDMRRALADEEVLLLRLENSNGDAWAALRHHNNSQKNSQYPPLYIYLHEDHRHRYARHNTAVKSESKTAAGEEDITTGGELSMKNVNGSDTENKHTGLSFAEFTAMDPTSKLACIRSMLVGPKDSCEGDSILPDEESSI
jgi:hypothetical protein